MITEYVRLAALAVLLVACAGTPSANPLLAERSDPTPEVKRACDLVTRRCTRCHTIDRVMTARVVTPAHWQRYVARMRLMPASGISATDAGQIVRCLVFRSFGNEGLETLTNEGVSR